MSGRIFISHRRGDDSGSAGRLFDALQQAFGADRLFIDVDNIEPGLDFVQVIEERLAQSDVLLAVIGSRWTDVRDADGSRRLDNPADFVRLELEVALARGKRLIPVMVDEARTLSPADLPESLRPLTKRNAVRIRHERFRSDTEALIGVLKRILGDGPESEIAKAQTSRPVYRTAPEMPSPPPAPVASTSPIRTISEEPAVVPQVDLAKPASRGVAYVVATVTALAIFGIALAVYQTTDHPNVPNENGQAPRTDTGSRSVQSAFVGSTTKKYDTGASDTEIKIGNIMAYSGPASAYGAIGKTEDAYFKKVNAAGGINGRKINFISYDDAYSPPKTVEQVRKLVESDEVLLVFSVLGTPPNTAIQKYLNLKQVPQLFILSGATKFGDALAFPWTMGWQPNYQTEGRVYAKYILQNKPNSKIAIMYQNDEYGRDYVKGMKDGLGAQASMIVGEESYEVSEPTVDAHIVKLRSTGADVFFDVATPRFAAQAIRKAAEIGWKPMHFLNNVSASVGSVIKPAGYENSQGIISAAYLKDTSDPQWNNDPGMKEFYAFLNNDFPEANKLDGSVVVGYAIAQTLVKILQMCGDNLTRENIMKQAANLKDFAPGLLLPGIKINTSPTDFHPIEQLQLMKFEGETWKLFGPVISGASGG